MKKLSIITGVSGDLGTALCTTFLKNGYEVFGIDLVNPLKLENLRFLKFDLNDAINIPSRKNFLFEEINKWKGSNEISVLINNAAYQFLSTKHPIDLSKFTQTLNVNLVAPYVLTSFLASDLEKTRGSVINISSVHARLTKPGFSFYASSKAALSMLTKSLAIDFGSKFRINCIEPAAINTKMLRDSFNNNKSKINELNSYHPQNKIADPKEIAELVLKITNSDIEFLHGSCIDMSGGISSRLHDPE
jgi:NAD(P)-dependent dehydrogenase (short-subunit alcohol dehydrogenase family)